MSINIINQGLTALAGTSKLIREGKTSKVPSIYRNVALSLGNEALLDTAISIEQGANSVLQDVGINPNLLSQFGISPAAVVTVGFNTAKSIFNNIVNGDFGLDSITDAITNPLVELEDFLNNTPEPVQQNGEDRHPSPWAVDKSSMHQHPKFKFLFVVEFVFYPDFQNDLTENGNNMAFLVRTASRPNVHVEYEDINMYNFKTKVAKSTEYQPVSMTFFDDQSNQTTSFYKKYLELLIPNMGMPESTVESYESSSFNFSDNTDSSPYNSSSLQALPGTSGHKNIIKSIRLFHIWGWGQYVNVYKFMNPKISEINIADLDMDSNDLSEISIEFTYDGLNIETATDDGNNISLDPSSLNSNGYNVPQYSNPHNRGKYPINYNGSSTDNVTMNGTNSNLSSELQRKSLDTIMDFTNPDAPDSDFLGFTDTSESNGFYSDFKNVLTSVGSNANNLINSTLSAARATLGSTLDSFPNISPIGDIFSGTAGIAAKTILKNVTKTQISTRDLDPLITNVTSTLLNSSGVRKQVSNGIKSIVKLLG